MIREYGQNSYCMIKSNAHKAVARKYIDVIKKVLDKCYKEY
jgi:vacuolar-type H+-ATPase subunit E/Vma4